MLKPSKGEWVVREDSRIGIWVEAPEERVYLDKTNEHSHARVILEDEEYDEKLDDARLTADAGTVFNKVKLTPSQLLEQRDKLYDALLEASSIFANYPEVAKELVGTFQVVHETINQIAETKKNETNK